MKTFWFAIRDSLKSKISQLGKHKSTFSINEINLCLTVILLIIALFTLFFTIRQTSYAELQSKDKLISNKRKIIYAVEECKKSNNSQSGLSDAVTDEKIPCSEILETNIK